MLGALILGAHRMADRFDLLPPEFAAAAPVDETAPEAVLAEWVRCLRLWADYSPEEVFGLKVGAGLLFATLVGLWVIVGLMR